MSPPTASTTSLRPHIPCWHSWWRVQRSTWRRHSGRKGTKQVTRPPSMILDPENPPGVGGGGDQLVCPSSQLQHVLYPSKGWCSMFQTGLIISQTPSHIGNGLTCPTRRYPRLHNQALKGGTSCYLCLAHRCLQTKKEDLMLRKDSYKCNLIVCGRQRFVF